MRPSKLSLLLCASVLIPTATAGAQDDDRYFDPVTEAGQQARGLYLGASFVRRHGTEAVIRAVHAARMNAVVLDLKDAEGRVHHRTDIAALRESMTGDLGDARALIEALHAEGIYVIARIACFADDTLPRRAPELAIRDVRPRRDVWVSWGTGGTWLDPHNETNQRLVVDLAREAEALGFDEIQLDYVRFPVDDGVQFAEYPAETETPRPDVILSMLEAIDLAVGIPLGVDVFGLAAYREGDPSGLGQDLERWTRHVEIYTPMLYINSMRSWRRGRDDRAFSLVFDGAWILRQRLGWRPVIRPFLQAFRQGADEFGPEFIFDQVRAARRARADGFLFWHPGHTYGVVRRAMRGRTRSLVPFPIQDSVLEDRAQSSSASASSP